jgi:putative zinc-dependent peptidase DUF5700
LSPQLRANSIGYPFRPEFRPTGLTPRIICRVFFLLLLGLFLLSAPALADEASRIQIHTDFSEADATLGILDKRSASQPVTDSDWQTLFVTEPYQRLKKREAAMHHDFTDDDFKKFILSDELLKQREALRRTVLEWKRADLRAAATRVLQYLPAESVIRTKVFPLIKPLDNSFVFDMDTDPAIFLYIDPSESPASFENDVAHEMHHIGLSSIDKLYEQKIAPLPLAASRVAKLMGLFGEGEAMLAATGGPDADPVSTETQEIKDNWARGKREFNTDLGKVSDFFLQVLDGKLQGDAISQKAFEFFGLQGPWYTVGYKMAVIVERRYGRAALIDCMRDPRLLLVRYNTAAREINKRSTAQRVGSEGGAQSLALWPVEILEKVQAPTH